MQVPGRRSPWHLLPGGALGRGAPESCALVLRQAGLQGGGLQAVGLQLRDDGGGGDIASQLLPLAGRGVVRGQAVP